MKKIENDYIVQHKMFGVGKVLDASNFNRTLVHFADEGQKLLHLQYAKLKVLSVEEGKYPELDNLGKAKK